MGFNTSRIVDRTGVATTTATVIGTGGVTGNAVYSSVDWGLTRGELTGQTYNADSVQKRNSFYISLPKTATANLEIWVRCVDLSKTKGDPNQFPLRLLDILTPGERFTSANFNSAITTAGVYVRATAGTVAYYAHETYGDVA